MYLIKILVFILYAAHYRIEVWMYDMKMQVILGHASSFSILEFYIGEE